MLCYAYVRVSTKEQEQEGYSIPAQQKHLQDYAARNGWTIDRWFIEAESAKQNGRPEFNTLVQSIRKGKKPVRLLVDKTDRLARNMKDGASIGGLVTKKGLEVHFIREGQILNTESSSAVKLMHNIQLALSTHYSDNLSDEVKKGMYQKARQGWLPGNVPYGYMNNKNTRGIDVVEEKAKLVRRAFNLYATGAYSLSSLANKLYEEGFAYSPNRAKIHTATLQMMLKNPFYMGLFRLTGRLYQGKHVPLVSVELYERVQRIGAIANRPKLVKHDFTYMGFITCADCGCAITAEIHRGKYVYYHCSNGRKVCSSKQYIRQEVLTEQFIQAIRRVQLPAEYIPEILDSLKKGLAEEQQYYRQQVKTIETQLTTLRNRQAKLYEDKLDGTIGHEFWQEQHNSYAQDIARLEEALRKHQQGNKDYIENGSRLIELAKNAHCLFISQSPSEQRRLINLVLSNIRLDRGNLHYEYKKPFDLFVKMAGCKEWWAILESNQ
jgi:site-specific DNA recombinase